MVPPEEIEKEQPATLPADFNEWDSGNAPAKESARPVTAKVAAVSAPEVEARDNFQDAGDEGKHNRRVAPLAAVGALVLLLALIPLGYSRLRPKTAAPKLPVATGAVTANAPLPAPSTATSSAPAASSAPSTAAPEPSTAAPEPSTADRQHTQAETMMNHQLNTPSRIPSDLKMLAGKEAPAPGFSAAGMEGLGGGGAGNVFSGQNGPRVRVGSPGKINISAGVAGGLLIQKTPPAYPQIARAARVSGTVVIEATIFKSGAVGNLRAVSGPTMLRQAALDAVRTWRYRPYMLDGEPVEVQTTVSVTFTLGG